MSGSGMWTISTSQSTTILRPSDVYLIGIFTGVLDESKPKEVRKGTKVARLLALLRSAGSAT
jgi:hypothetical protein